MENLNFFCRKMREFSPIREQMSIQRCWYVQTFTDEEVSCPLLDEWKDGEVWIRNYEDDREGNVLRPYEAVIIGTAVNIVKAG